jgi:hypothetical protein
MYGYQRNNMAYRSDKNQIVFFRKPPIIFYFKDDFDIYLQCLESKSGQKLLSYFDNTFFEPTRITHRTGESDNSPDTMT